MAPKHRETFFVVMLVYAVSFIAAVVFSTPGGNQLSGSGTTSVSDRPVGSRSLITPAAVDPACEKGKFAGGDGECSPLRKDQSRAI